MFGTLRPASRFDLHLHSARSDGRHPPDEVLRRAARAGLEVIALTDHDLASPLRPGIHDIDGHRIHLLGGAEVSGTHQGREFHLLVYFPDEVPEGFRAFCQEQSRLRAVRYEAARESIGLDLPHADDDALRGDRALTRLHLAKSLVAAGHATCTRDAFQRFLSRSHGHVPTLDLPFVDAIRLARAFGGVTSWAHPPIPAVRAFLPEFVEAGLQGLEALRPMIPSADRSVHRRAARRHGLFLTGGSDWHGWQADGPLGLFRVHAREIGGFVDVIRAA